MVGEMRLPNLRVNKEKGEGPLTMGSLLILAVAETSREF